MRFVLLFIPCLLLPFLGARAEDTTDGQARRAFITASRSGRYFFKMVPGSPAHGEAFEVQADGVLQELWKVTGWYARQLYLAEDGRTLVRVQPSVPGSAVAKTDLAIAFYKDGELVREYHTADLVKKPGAVRRGNGSYLWLAPAWVTATDSRQANGTSRVERDPDAEPMLDTAGIFKLKTIDQIVYQFEASTGKLIKRTLP